MKILLKLISLVGLAMSIFPPILFFLGKMELSSMKLWMGIGMVVWMISAPFWINKPSEQ
ncbi:hypothetical protein [Algoriphagus lacus]|uniref:hypothetical protein n=1 Tax=Algoriphagus lacus TaxID=2056311 RepID=UPI0018F5641D|nr:hypothetical protein [Algoriphagus lacus]